jgi:hypothetical protein
MTSVVLSRGHLYRAALHLGWLESKMSGQIIPALEKEGFTDVVIYEDAASLPPIFATGSPNLKTVPEATHWASGTYQGADGAVKDLPSQLRQLRDDGLSANPPGALPPLVTTQPPTPPWMLPPLKGGAPAGLSPAVKFGIAALILGAALGIGIVVVRSVSRPARESNPRRRRRRRA